MSPEDRERFPSVDVRLKDGRSASLRLLRHDDGEGLAAMYEGLPAEAARFYWPHPLERDQALANASRADSPTEVVLVMATPDEAVGGYAWYRWSDETSTASVFGICIARDYQSCGAGGVLMTRLLEIAHDIGPATMLLTCQHANTRAVTLYQKMGFKITKEGVTGQRRMWAPEPQYWMERSVR